MFGFGLKLTSKLSSNIKLLSIFTFGQANNNIMKWMRVHCSLEMFSVRLSINRILDLYLSNPCRDTFEWKHFLAVNLINFCQIFISKSRCRKSILIAYSQWWSTTFMCMYNVYLMLHIASDLEIDIDSISIKLWYGGGGED